MRDIVERSDLQAEFAALGEFAKAGAEGAEIVTRNVGCATHGRLADVVDAIAVQSKAVIVVLPLDQLQNILANANQITVRYQSMDAHYLDSFSKNVLVSSSVSGRMLEK